MATWIATKEEINRRKGDYDGVRRERIRAVEVITGRPLIIYAAAFLEKGEIAQGEVNINHFDPIGLDEVLSSVKGDALDVLIHSPGGSPEAAESIVTLLRSHFNRLRFIVPHMAKSAATMICCAGDEILMDERSELGPIDPQMQLVRGDGKLISAPAQAILKQFDKATAALSANPNQIAAWLPILQPLGPSLLTECDAANALGLSLVENWLQTHMFAGNEEKKSQATSIARSLADSDTHFSHGRRIGIEQAKQMGLHIADMRETPELRDAVWQLFHAILWTFSDTMAVKIVESGDGTAFIRQLIVQQILPTPSVPGGSPPRPTDQPQRRQLKSPPTVTTGHPSRSKKRR